MRISDWSSDVCSSDLVIARQHHLFVGRQFDRARYVRRAEVKLRTIALEERRMTATLVLGQNVHLGREVRVRLDRAGLGQHLAALDVFTLGAAQQDTDVIRSEEHTSELQSLMRISYAVFGWKKKNYKQSTTKHR